MPSPRPSCGPRVAEVRLDQSGCRLRPVASHAVFLPKGRSRSAGLRHQLLRQETDGRRAGRRRLTRNGLGPGASGQNTELGVEGKNHEHGVDREILATQQKVV